jgi:hypothetical protein
MQPQINQKIEKGLRLIQLNIHHTIIMSQTISKNSMKGSDASEKKKKNPTREWDFLG